MSDFQNRIDDLRDAGVLDATILRIIYTCEGRLGDFFTVTHSLMDLISEGLVPGQTE